MLASKLALDGVAGTVLSNDADALLFGSPHVTRSLNITKQEIERCLLQDLMTAIELDLEGLKNLAILSGCDFHNGLRGIGPRKGSQLLKRFGSLDGVLKSKGVKLSEREAFLEARTVFDEAMHLSIDSIQTTFRPPSVPKINSLLTPITGQERAEQIGRESVSLWKNFGREQLTLETWV